MECEVAASGVVASPAGQRTTDSNIPWYVSSRESVADRRRAGECRTRHLSASSTGRWFRSVVDTGFDGEHGAGGVKQDALGVGPQDELADRGAPAQADHDEVRVDLVGNLDQVL
jgi:hypothetical protein